MSDLDEFKATYFDECAELLADLEEQFAAISAGDHSPDRLNAAFRAIHSIKGGGGAFGFSTLVAFAHAYETLLDLIRTGRVPLSETVIALCVRANDMVADHVSAARTDSSLPGEFGRAEVARFAALANGEADTFAQPPGALLGEIEQPPAIEAPKVAGRIPDKEDPAFDIGVFVPPPATPRQRVFSIRFTPHTELYARANDPLLLFRELATLGRLEVRALLGRIPPLADFEPFGVYCGWDLTLTATDCTETSIREVFEFVEGNCDLVIAETGSVAAEPAPPSPAIPLEPIIRIAALARAGAEPAERVGSDAAASPPAAPRPVAAMPEPLPIEFVLPDMEGDRRNGVQSIRVDLEKVDRVVNMVGELVITQSMLTQQMDDHLRERYQELVRGLEVLAQTTRGLQDSVMAIRAQPVKSVFSRMPRLMRELAQKTNKKIRLESVGEQTEIDKTVIEQLSDPLTHMIRNSVDHGIEMPEMRLALGKPETGTIRLSAEQAGGNILIVVEDDGAGINRERVLAVARERGLAAPDQQFTDEQIDNMIFAPGFSTAEAVSDISGRGVGMDVVLSNIKKIGGSVNVRSTPGRGTRMTMRLPLTLAVLEVMLVKVAGSPYVIPLSSIVETIQCARAEFGRAPSGAPVLRVRGEYVRVIDLTECFEMPMEVPLEQRFVVLCEAEGAVKVALVVDDIVGQQQVVIKSLEQNFERIEGIAGGTILGDGKVALIIDVQGLQAAPARRRAA